MLFMVVEHFRGEDARAVYQRFQEHGRMAPDDLKVHGSWIEAGYARCFQIMECEDLATLQEWVLNWNDLARFEIVPVLSSKDTSEIVYRRLEQDNSLGTATD